jgi:hypothetical protein
MKLKTNSYLQGFAAVVVLLAALRLVFPEIAEGKHGLSPADADSLTTEELAVVEEIPATQQTEVPAVQQTEEPVNQQIADKKNGRRFHRILSVPSYREAFPDTNALQLQAAQKWGVLPVKNRADAETRKKELVYIGSSPYYFVDPLYSSIPYLVPRAAILLNDMGQAFFDSLHVKGVPLHRFIVTSVLRSQDDIARLRSRNSNATENSCHLYGTTFDIGYNRYKTVEDPDGLPRRLVRDDTLKWVLSEVLRDLREQDRCYVKYERKQGCFHVTVR